MQTALPICDWTELREKELICFCKHQHSRGILKDTGACCELPGHLMTHSHLSSSFTCPIGSLEYCMELSVANAS